MQLLRLNFSHSKTELNRNNSGQTILQQRAVSALNEPVFVHVLREMSHVVLRVVTRVILLTMPYCYYLISVRERAGPFVCCSIIPNPHTIINTAVVMRVPTWLCIHGSKAC